MAAKEFIDENYFSLTLDCKREIKEIYQALEDYAESKDNFNKKDKKTLLKLVCDDAQNKTNKGLEVTNEMYDLRYKLRDSF